MKKNAMDTDLRNAIVEKYLPMIGKVMRRNAVLIQAARLDSDDVYQQLALRLIRAVETFNPAKGELKAHLYSQLHYELLTCKNSYRQYGITGAPRDSRQCRVVSMDALRETRDWFEYELAA
ncbi:MAG: hypothetical protein J6X53_03045 [Abditibacteriota bacterium]|nr:hypothetical protein [Abditibacteriota bacterium]